jgi:hypothetical protein
MIVMHAPGVVIAGRQSIDECIVICGVAGMAGTAGRQAINNAFSPLLRSRMKIAVRTSSFVYFLKGLSADPQAGYPR